MVPFLSAVNSRAIFGGAAVRRFTFASRAYRAASPSLPANCQDMVIQRILVRHGVSKDLGASLIEDIRRCLDYFKAHPITGPMRAEEATGYHH